MTDRAIQESDTAERDREILAQIRARLEAATPGPWYAVDGHHTPWTNALVIGTDAEGLYAVAYTTRGFESDKNGDGCPSWANGNFIAHAPADIAFLLDLVSRARAEERESKWQDIATAPKDGTYIAIARDMGEPWGWVRGIAYYVPAGPRLKIEGWVPTSGFSEVPGVLGLAAPTHWQPLPLPPPPSSGRG